MHSMHKKMSHNKEWYWNLNIHRDQTTLANVSANTGVHLPKSSSCYTNAVITDVGLCVGMRNVNLSTENAPYFGKASKMPNCCSNLNVVGQHNEQIWAMAYDRMKYSMLTDPSMATFGSSATANQSMDSLYASYSYHQSQHPYHYHDNWKPQMCCNQTNGTTNKAISAGASPFHLFGDRCKLPSSQHANIIAPSTPYFTRNELIAEPIDRIDEPMDYVQPMHMNGEQSIGWHGNDLLNSRHYNNNNSYSDTSNNNIGSRITVCGPLFSYSMASFESSVDSEASSEKNNDHNVSRSDHVAPPKKKWMQNYMQSNSTTYYYTHIASQKCVVVVVPLLISMHASPPLQFPHGERSEARARACFSPSVSIVFSSPPLPPFCLYSFVD